jgi:hypothetical protein
MRNQDTTQEIHIPAKNKQENKRKSLMTQNTEMGGEGFPE